MAYIRVIDENEAEGGLFKIYDEIQKTRGRVSNVMRIQSLDTGALKTHLDMYMSLIFGKGPLSRREREILAVVVSSTNGCGYCLTHHSEALQKYAKDDAFVRALGKDPGMDLEPREAALRDYAVGLTKSPGAGRKEAVDALRAAGCSDEEILHATEIVGYFNFVNRLVAGLGVELEDDASRDFEY